MAEKLRFYSSSADNLDAKAVETDPSVAKQRNVKSNYLFKDANTRELLAGSMPTNPSVSIKIDPVYEGSSLNEYIIPEGYHDGTSRIYTGELSEYTPGNATEGDVVNNKIFWVNGVRKVGTLNVEMADQEATATEEDIVEGATAWVNKSKITGTIPKLPRKDMILNPGESYTLPYGLSLGTSVISAASLDNQTSGTASAPDIAYGQTAWVNGEKITGTLKISEEIDKMVGETDALKNQVLSGKKFYSSAYDQVMSGSMIDHTGEAMTTIPVGYQYAIPEGYYDGYTKIATQSLEDATPGSAIPSYIVAEKTAWVNGEKITGTMPYIDPIEESVDAGTVYTIPEGYHTGRGSINVKPLSKETIGDATAEMILDSKTAWVNGYQVTGTMPNNPDLNEGITPGDTFYVPKGYHSGTGTVWVKPLSEFTQATATDGDIKTGKSAWVNGAKLEGSMPINEAEDIVLGAGAKITIPEGYHDGTGTVEAEVLDNQTPGTARASEIVKNKTAWVNGAKITGTMELEGTAALNDVLEGATFYNIDPSKKLTGTLALTGTATEDDVAEGVSFYNTNAKRKLTGSMKLSGTAIAENVLAGTSFYNTSVRTKIDGSMPNIGSVIVQLDSGSNYTIPKGYHDGTGIVKAPTLATSTDGTAEAADIYSGKTAWVNGEKITGIMSLNGTVTPDKVVAGYTYYSTNPKQQLVGTMGTVAAQIVKLNAGEEYTIPSGVHSGDGQVVTATLAEQTVADATASNILASKTAWVNGTKITGTMVNRGAVSATLECGETYNIPEGYHSGAGSVSVGSLEAATAGDATAEYIVADKVAWVNGEKVIGTMPSNEAVSKTLSAGESYTIPEGYYNGEGTITVESLESQTVGDALPEEIVATKTAWVNGVKVTGTASTHEAESKTLNCGDSYTINPGFYTGTGTISAASLASQTVGDAGSDSIFAGKIAWVNGEKVVGTIESQEPVSKSLNAGESFTLPSGFYDGSSVISANSLASQTVADAEATHILSGKTAWVNGTKITGSIESKAAVSKTLSCGDSVSILAGFYSADSTVSAASLASQTVADAESTHILSGKTAWVNGVKVTGEIEYQEAVTKTLSAGESYEVPAGLYGDPNVISAASLASQTEADAEPNHIVYGKTAWVNGNKITGTIAVQNSVIRTINAGASVTIPAGVYDEDSTITGASLASQTVADAEAGHIVSGKTAWVNGVKITGTIDAQEAVSKTINAGESVTIPVGVYGEESTITGASLASQTMADAESSHIVYGKTAWVNGVQITGTITEQTAVTETIDAGESVSIPAGVYTGTSMVTASSLASQTVGDATADQIIIDKIAWVNGEKIVGTMSTNEPESVTLACDETYTIPSGLHGGTGTVTAASLASQTPADATSGDMLLNTTAWVNGDMLTGTIPTSQYTSVRVNSGNDVTLPAGYYPNGVTIYCLYTDRLDLTGTNAWYDADDQSLHPEDSGYVDSDALVVTAEIYVGEGE